MKKTVILFLLFVSQLLVAQAPDKLFSQANEAYADANYKEATRLYKKLLQEDWQSSELHFNLANTYYKVGEVAPSIYHYEMALLLSPGNKTYKNNLKFAEQKRIDEVKSPEKSKFDLRIESLLNWFSVSQWAKISIGFAIFSLICFAVFLYLKKVFFKRLFFTLFVLCSLFCFMSFYLANKQVYLSEAYVYGIIFAEETSIFTEPNQNTNILFKLHEGTKVKVEDDFRNFTKIRLSNNVTGWIETADLKKLQLN